VEREEYSRSDQLSTIHLPGEEPFRTQALQLKEALASEDRKALQVICNALAKELAAFYNVAPPPVKILNKRPLKTSEGWTTESMDANSCAEKGYFVRRSSKHFLP
jgi:hypothetical protein